MAEFVVFETGDRRIFSRANLGARRRVARDGVERVGFEIGAAVGEVGLGVDHEFREIGFVEGLDATGEGHVAQNDDGG